MIRTALEITPACRISIIVDRHLSHTVRKTHRQFSGGIYFSGQHIDDGMTTFRTGKPDFQNGFRQTADLSKIQGTTVKKNNCHIGIYPYNLFQKFQLNLWDLDIRLTGCFSGFLEMFAKRHDHQIGFCRCLQSFLFHLSAFFFRRLFLNFKTKLRRSEARRQHRTPL